MPHDVGDLFQRLTRRARGGRRATDRRDARRESSDRPRLRDRVRASITGRRSATRGRHIPTEGVVTIEYSPSLDGDPDPGEVVWTWVPFEDDPSQGKDRPVVVIGRRGRSLVGVPLTTKRSDREAQVAIGTGAWDSKRRDSFARIGRMTDIDPDHMRREGAVLDEDRFERVVRAVDEHYDVRRGV